MMSKGLDFIEVNAEYFNGGYFLNQKLPYRKENFIYKNSDQDIMVLLSGSVYNRADLLKQQNLIDETSDPELIAMLFLDQGPDFVKGLNGDFGIYILQPSKKKSYLFRDHVGIKPLAYYHKGHHLFFSSDIMSLCRSISPHQHIETDFLLGMFKYIDYRKQADERVRIVEPGHYLEFSEVGLIITRYWDPGIIKIDRSLGYEEMLSDLKTILFDAVRIRCDTHYSAGAHVSSGLDSGIVSTLARREYSGQKNFHGFSWSPENFKPDSIDFDERDIVRKTCKDADIVPVFSKINQDDFLRFVKKPMDNQGFFYEDMVLKQAGELDVNLIFSGWGGDEFISMPDRGIDSDLFFKLRWCKFFKKNPPRRIKWFTRNFLYYVIFPALGILDFATRKSFREDAHYIRKPFKRSDKNAIRNFYFYKTRRELHLGLLKFYHLNQRTENWAINGFRHGVEYRYPLLDKRILEYVMKVPSKILCGSDFNRIILREIGEGILAEKVRWHWKKTDPVYFAMEKVQIKNAAISLMDEVKEWKTNPEFCFLDFDLLEKDINAFRNASNDGDYNNLFGTLVYTKILHEFIKEYKSLS